VKQLIAIDCACVHACVGDSRLGWSSPSSLKVTDFTALRHSSHLVAINCHWVSCCRVIWVSAHDYTLLRVHVHSGCRWAGRADLCLFVTQFLARIAARPELRHIIIGRQLHHNNVLILMPVTDQIIGDYSFGRSLAWSPLCLGICISSTTTANTQLATYLLPAFKKKVYFVIYVADRKATTCI